MKLKKVVCLCGAIGIGLGSVSINAYAANDIKVTAVQDIHSNQEQEEFKKIISIIEAIKNQNPGLTEKELQDKVEIALQKERGIFDIWNSLTDSEKKLVIRYPFDALKVNTAKDIAQSQTEKKFGHNGLGDRSDAFRHGIWNAEMTILIGSDKAELFATAHEDKDTEGTESDGFSKEEHKNMDLHNNAVGRSIGELNKTATEDELAEIIYAAVNAEDTEFVWLHE